MNRLLSIAQAGKIAGMSDTALLRWIKREQIPTVSLGKKNKAWITESNLQRIVEAKQNAQKPKG